MDVTRFITFDSCTAHALQLAARGEHKNVEEYLSDMLTRLFRAMADLKGIEAAPSVSPAHITRAGRAAASPAHTAAPEPQPALPAPAPLIAEPAPVESRPMTPEEEDALLGTIGA